MKLSEKLIKEKQVDESIHPCDYLHQIVLCLDISKSMKPMLDELKNKIDKFYEMFVTDRNANGFSAGGVVLRFMTYGGKDVPITMSDYFFLPLDNFKMVEYINHITLKGEELKRDTLGALKSIIKSDWIDFKDLNEKLKIINNNNGYQIRGREIICILSDGDILPLDDKSFNELEELWENGSPEYPLFNRKYKRLLIFAPRSPILEKAGNWNICWSVYCDSNKGLDDIELENIIDMIDGAI